MERIRWSGARYVPSRLLAMDGLCRSLRALRSRAPGTVSILQNNPGIEQEGGALADLDLARPILVCLVKLLLHEAGKHQLWKTRGPRQGDRFPAGVFQVGCARRLQWHSDSARRPRGGRHLKSMADTTGPAPVPRYSA